MSILWCQEIWRHAALNRFVIICSNLSSDQFLGIMRIIPMMINLNSDLDDCWQKLSISNNWSSTYSWSKIDNVNCFFTLSLSHKIVFLCIICLNMKSIGLILFMYVKSCNAVRTMRWLLLSLRYFETSRQSIESWLWSAFNHLYW